MHDADLCSQNLIAAGIFTLVYRISATTVRKVPRDNDPDNVQAVSNEANIYALLGGEDRIATCLSAGRVEDYVDLEWAVHGTLEDYVRKNGSRLTVEDRFQLGRRMIESVQLIHGRGVIHSDLALRQFLMYEDLKPRLSDFTSSGYAGQSALGVENASHYMPRRPDQPNSVRSDLFALGSTLYELVQGQCPYEGLTDDRVESLYAKGLFPRTKRFFCGDVILNCWKGSYGTAGEVLAAYDQAFEASRVEVVAYH